MSRRDHAPRSDVTHIKNCVHLAFSDPVDAPTTSTSDINHIVSMAVYITFLQLQRGRGQLLTVHVSVVYFIIQNCSVLHSERLVYGCVGMCMYLGTCVRIPINLRVDKLSHLSVNRVRIATTATCKSKDKRKRHVLKFI